MNTALWDILASKNVLLQLNPKDCYEKQAVIIRRLLSKPGASCIYVTFGHSKKNLARFFNRNHIHGKNLFYIDMVSATTKDSSPERDRNCLYLQHPGCLSDLALALNEITHSDHSHKILVIDSVEAALQHNSQREFAEFLQQLKHNSHKWGTKQIIITTDEIDSKLHSFGPMFDAVTEYKGD